MRISGTGTCSKGFTLLELAAALFIISIMLVLVMPSFSVVGNRRMTSDAKKIASVMRYLNDASMTSKETLALKVDLRERLITYDSPDNGRAASLPVEDLRGVEAQSKGMVREGELIIFFGPTGAGEAVTFHLDNGKEAVSVAFNPLSGRVKIRQ